MGGMTTENERPGAQQFVALEIALHIIRELRRAVSRVRRHDVKIAQQIVAAASSVAANLAEGNRRCGADRLHFFRIAAGSADETRTHLRVAVAWGWLTDADVQPALALIDRQLRLLWGLTR